MSPNFYDVNEEYVCDYCCKPVEEKYLYCSEECSELANMDDSNDSNM
jgi:hypothetical protein